MGRCTRQMRADDESMETNSRDHVFDKVMKSRLASESIHTVEVTVIKIIPYDTIHETHNVDVCGESSSALTDL